MPVAEPTREILTGIDLTVRKGEVHAIMGRNGSGKTTLAYALMGHPAYQVTKGEVLWKGATFSSCRPTSAPDWASSSPSSTRPPSPACRWPAFLRTALNARTRPLNGQVSDVDLSDPLKGGIKMADFRKLVREKMQLLKLDDGFAARYVNEGFSGGEKKRLEMLQMAVLQPEMAILDETDSGLDIDALRIVADGVNAQLSPDLGVLLITHYQRLLNYITPDFVHVLAAGRIIASGGKGSPCASRRRATRRSCARPASSRPTTTMLGRSSPSTRKDTAEMAVVRHSTSRPSAPTSHLRARLQRPPPAYLDSAATSLQAARCRRGGERLPDALLRQHPPWRLPDRRGGDRGLRGRAKSIVVHQRTLRARDRDGAQRDRGDQPRRLLVGPPASIRPTRSC